MSTSTYIDMVGKIFWAKVYEPDMAFGSSNYKIDFQPDNDADWEKFNKSGIQKKVNEDERGRYFQLVRPAYKLIKGAVVNFTSPIIYDKEGKVIVDWISKETGKRIYSYDLKDKENVERRGTPVTIGNGSTVRVTVNVFDTIKGKGHRLDAIKILDLIEFKRDPNVLPALSTMYTPLDIPKDDLSKDEIPFGKKDDKKSELPW